MGGGNPFDLGFNTAQPMENRPGPSAESWNKDLGDLGKKQIDSFKPKPTNEPTVQEFKDLFSIADSKIKNTAGTKQRSEHTYNPIGVAPQKAAFNPGDNISVNTTVNQSAVMSEQPVAQTNPKVDDPFGFGTNMSEAPVQA